VRREDISKWRDNAVPAISKMEILLQEKILFKKKGRDFL